DFKDRIAGDVNAAAFDAFAQEIHAAALGVRQQDVTAVVNNPTIDLFGHAVVVAAVASLHVIDRDAEPLGDDGRERAVGIAENQKLVRLLILGDTNSALSAI